MKEMRKEKDEERKKERVRKRERKKGLVVKVVSKKFVFWVVFHFSSVKLRIIFHE